MYAILDAKGKQYKVQAGEKIRISKLENEENSTVKFDQVIAVVPEGSAAKIGTPYVPGATVECKILRHGMGKKVVAFHYKPKKRIRIKRGHRQPYTLVSINSINTGN